MTRSHVDYDPELRAMLAGHCSAGGFVPIAEGGKLSHFISERLMANVRVHPTMSVGDFVAGLELLGYRLALTTDTAGRSHFTAVEPSGSVPVAWQTHAYRILTAMPPERDEEIADFLAGRIATFRKREIVKALVDWADHGDGCEAVPFVHNAVPDASETEIDVTAEWIIDTLSTDRHDEIARRHIEGGHSHAA